MGIFDSMQELMSRGMAATERSTRSISLKTQMAEATRKLDHEFSALGKSVFEAAQTDESLRTGREELFVAIEAVQAQCKEIQRQIDEIDQLAAEARAAAMKDHPCPQCGTIVSNDFKFCPTCGTPMAEPAKPQTAQPVTPLYETTPPAYTQPAEEVVPDHVADVAEKPYA